MKIRFQVRYYLLQVFERITLLRALKISLLVGILLNIINNPSMITSLSFAEMHLGRVILTFIVPFGVSAYSSILSKITVGVVKNPAEKGTDCE